MGKKGLIEALKTKFNITKPESAQILQIFFDTMGNSLVKNECIQIRGLCSFQVKKYKCYTGRNPKTGDNIKVKSKKLPFFKCGKELKERVDY